MVAAVAPRIGTRALRISGIIFCVPIRSRNASSANQVQKTVQSGLPETRIRSLYAPLPSLSSIVDNPQKKASEMMGISLARSEQGEES